MNAQDIANNNQDISDLNDSIDVHRSEIGEAKDTLNAHRSDLDEAEDSLAAHRNNIDVNAQDIANNNQDISDLNDSIDVHRSEIGEAKDTLNAHRTDIDANAQEISINDQDISDLNDSVDTHRTDIDANTQEISINDQDISELNDSINAHRTDIDNIVPESTTAGNGLSLSGYEVQLGGTLSKETTITHGDNDLIHDLTGAGDFKVRDNGTTAFVVQDDGYVGLTNGTTVNELSTDGTLSDSSDDAVPTEQAVKTYVDAQIDDEDWSQETSPADYLQAKAGGLSLSSSTLYGTNANTHVNFGYNSVTGDSGQNYEYSVVVGGYNNTASGDHAVAIGGKDNDANGYAVSVGGVNNTASDSLATIGGGRNNVASGHSALVGGGENNTASGDYSMVGGGFNTASGWASFVGGGAENEASSNNTAVGGGYENVASGWFAFIGGGGYNTASRPYSAVGGGDSNEASGNYAAAVGGKENTASGYAVAIGGGENNTANDSLATIGGGRNNVASGHSALVGGGENNTASGDYSMVGGGYKDSASAYGATVPGGEKNKASGVFSFAAGYKAKANHDGAFVWADSTDSDFESTSEDQFLVRASGGVGIGTNDPDEQLEVNGAIIIGVSNDTLNPENGTIMWNGAHFAGYNGSSWKNLDESRLTETQVENYITNGAIDLASGSSVGGGTINDWNYLTNIPSDIADGDDAGDSDWTEETSPASFLRAKAGGIASNDATLYGTDANTHVNFGFGPSKTGNTSTSASYSTVSGGYNNGATGTGSAVSGGVFNTARESYSYVGGGSFNYAGELASGVLSGSSNTSNGYYSTVVGGRDNVIEGDYSVIAGGPSLTIGAYSFGFKGFISPQFSNEKGEKPSKRPPQTMGGTLVGNISPVDVSEYESTFHIVDAKFWFNYTNNPSAEFRVDGQNDYLIMTDPMNDYVGIGKQYPDAKLDVDGDVASSGTMTASAFSSSSPLLLQAAGNTVIYADDNTLNVGIGTNTPDEQLEVNGAIIIGSADNTETGTIEWNGSNFRGYDGSSWVNLDGSGSIDTSDNYIWTGKHTFKQDTAIIAYGGKNENDRAIFAANDTSLVPGNGNIDSVSAVMEVLVDSSDVIADAIQVDNQLHHNMASAFRVAPGGGRMVLSYGACSNSSDLSNMGHYSVIVYSDDSTTTLFNSDLPDSAAQGQILILVNNTGMTLTVLSKHVDNEASILLVYAYVGNGNKWVPISFFEGF